MKTVTLTVAREVFPLAAAFTISRGSKTAAEVVTVTVTDGVHTGRGEGVPYARYGEFVPQVVAALESKGEELTASDSNSRQSWDDLPFSARNALDCAFWDLRAKSSGSAVWQLAGLTRPRPVTTAYTLSLGTAAAMADTARKTSHLPLLKLKLGTADDRDRIAAIRAAAPRTRLIIDANEGWTSDNIAMHLAACEQAGVELVEQPLPAGEDDILRDLPRNVLICADESAHGVDSLPALAGKYDAVNIKLDKTGGLTPAITMLRSAQAQGLKIMVGCMVGTSLAMAPALMLTAAADFVDLDGPLLLKADREPGLRYENCVIAPAPRALWG